MRRSSRAACLDSWLPALAARKRLCLGMKMNIMTSTSFQLIEKQCDVFCVMLFVTANLFHLTSF
jgi:hypothetical protein